MNIQEETKRVLKAEGLSQEELAKKIGVHPVTLSLLLKNPEQWAARRRLTAYDKLVLFLNERNGSSSSTHQDPPCSPQ